MLQVQTYLLGRDPVSVSHRDLPAGAEVTLMGTLHVSTGINREQTWISVI